MHAPSQLYAGHRPACALAVLIAVGGLLAVAQWRPNAATAAADHVVLTIYPNGPGSVTASPTPLEVTPPVFEHPGQCLGTVDQGVACQLTYARGTQVTLTATADDASASFQGWTDVRCEGTQPCIRALTEDQEYVGALFAPQTVSVDLAGSGTVTANGKPCVQRPVGVVEPGAPAEALLDCGAAALFETVTLEATGDQPLWVPELCDQMAPATDASPGRASCVVIADHYRWTRVGFGGAVPQANLPPGSRGPLKVLTEGSGSVRSQSGKIACPGRCSLDGSVGDTEILTAQEAPGWRFAGWKGCRPVASAPKTCVARLAVTLRATFVKGGGAAAKKSSTVALLGTSGKGPKRRVRFVVDLGAAGDVHAVLTRGSKSFGRYSAALGAGRRSLAVRVKKGAKAGSYRLKVRITGAAPRTAGFDVKLGR